MNDYSDLTPLMQQYVQVKKEFQQALVLFQVGDFYELFYDDAKTAAAFLGIALTSRNKNDPNSIPLCGVPVHALDYYLAKLVKGGFHVAICDQLEEPTPGKVVRRGVTRVLTPGTLTEASLLDEKSPSYLLAGTFFQHEIACLFFEMLTGQLYATIFSAKEVYLLEAELQKFFPDEIVLPAHQLNDFGRFFQQLGYRVSFHDTTQMNSDACMYLDQSSQEMITRYESLSNAWGLLYSYLAKNQLSILSEIRHITWYQPQKFLMLDAATQKNLELIHNNQDASLANTLFQVLDCAVTSMGSRRIKKWLLFPLRNESLIKQRQEVIIHFTEMIELHKKMRDFFLPIGDLERVVGRIALDRASMHDYVHLTRALKHIQGQVEFLQKFIGFAYLQKIYFEAIQQITQLAVLLDNALHDDPAHEWIIKEGFDEQLDYLRAVVEQSNKTLLEFERQEQHRTGISSLKIRYNQVHGYYIEITKAHLDRVPEEYIRNQTLVGRERYTCSGLKRLEHELLSGRQEAERIEQEVFVRIKQLVKKELMNLRKLTHSLAEMDALFGLALSAYCHHYVKPQFNDQGSIDIKQGRHPVLDSKNPQQIIANDVYLDQSNSIFIITGPNMGGKSTFLRMIALIGIMAQIGSLVPASSASLPLFDRIFTRIGAGDNLAEGKSTFFVEMNETAVICTEATKQSLIILDEIGRGTSTYDGVAIAQAVLEYIYQSIGALCLFATHYHELTQLENTYPGIKNMHAASKRTAQEVLLLYKITQGTADGSFGIDVARQAGLPTSIIERAFTLQQTFSASSVDIKNVTVKRSMIQDEWEKCHLISDMIKGIELNDLTPRQALDVVWRIKEMI